MLTVVDLFKNQVLVWAVVGGKSVSENASVHGFTPLLPAVARAGLGLLSG